MTGGMLKARTMRTYDAQGIGIKGKENIGYKQVAYPVKEVIAYLEQRAARQPKKLEGPNSCGGQANE